MKVAVAGEGAFGVRHLEAIAAIEGVEVACLAGGEAEATRGVAQRFGIPDWSLGIEACLERADVDAVILATPTPLHAAQAIQCLEAGKPVLVEIPIADNLDDALRLAEMASRTGVTAMAGHVRRFNPSHQWVGRRLRAGHLTLRQLEVQTHFLRRSNLNALGQPRSWTDHLLWHHAAHGVDLFLHQTGEAPQIARAVQGPPHPPLGIAMDLAIQLKAPSGVIGALSLSFNNDGPLGSTYRYICDEGTFVARYDELSDGWGRPVDVSGVGVSGNGLELQDREFLAAIGERREPQGSVAQVLPCYRVLDVLARDLEAQA